MGPKVIQFAQRLAEDQPALAQLSMSRTALTYTTTHGLAKAFRDSLSATLKGKFFSLNIDEATNNSMDKLINVMLQHYDEEQGRVVLDHLGTRRENLATSENITLALDTILGDLSWSQVIACLMDNCSVMRGTRSGVETRIRSERNKYLLDISGDTVHMVNNAAKKLFSTFENFTENFCSDVYYDIEQSPKAKELLAEIQNLMNLSKVKTLVRPISSRFLQMLDVTARTCELLDCLQVYFYSFLPTADKVAYENILGVCLKRHLVTEEARARISEIQLHLSQQAKSDTNSNRKVRITKALFQDFLKLKCHLNLYRGILPQFQGFVKKFQSEKPMHHILLSEMYQLTVEFLTNFIKPDKIPDKVSDLVDKSFDPCDQSVQLSDRNLAVGPYCYSEINKARIEKLPWAATFYKALREGYGKAGMLLVTKLPLGNRQIANLSALDPIMRKETSTLTSFEELARALPNVVHADELGELRSEVRSYTVDSCIRNNGWLELFLKKKKHNEERIDTDWWTKVFQIMGPGTKKEKYPILSKLVKALLSIFCGPVVESSFNIMDDILESDRSSMSVENYEGISRVKYGLKKRGTTAVKMETNPKIRRACHNAYRSYKQFLKHKQAQKEKKMAEKVSHSVKLLKLKKAKEAAKKTKQRKPMCEQRKRTAKSLPTHKTHDKCSEKPLKRPLSNIVGVAKPIKGFKIPKLT
jgi:hypothetical protein